ncbi:glycosyltransferase family 4 protein [Acidiferrobacter sp.]|uniref:MraY family glycosyltransferase n=1 Tax=Acidiferrobacter sp. TaxID=1872107 RepID=UPI00262A1284|nr:glycosyltransferase family 4 protein [Acidiferrobacter sp.]
MSAWSWSLDAAGAAVAWLACWLLSHPRNPWQVLDWPNERSLHDRPVPRTGGLAILCGALVAAMGLSWGFTQPGFVITAAMVAVALVSWLDDQWSVSPRTRLVVHAVAALAVAAGATRLPALWLPGVAITLGAPLAILATVVFLVWWINLYNFMDGMDGFAGGMAVFGFATLAALAYRAHDPGLAGMALAVASAALGFTVANFPPARLFMGDMGATLLGFAAGIMILVGAGRGDFPLWAGLAAFSPFLVDATVTLARRVARGERLTAAHRGHYYQRLVRAGLSHRRTVLGEYAVMAVCGLAAFGGAEASVPVQWAIIAALAALYGALAALVERWEGRGQISGKDAR